jgi:hypothetical protein
MMSYWKSSRRRYTSSVEFATTIVIRQVIQEHRMWNLLIIPQNLCLNKAVKSGIRSARLPIGRYLASLPTRKVLTVNQVFEILAKWVETKDWEQALYSIIPKRKFQQGKNEDAVQVVDAAAVEYDSQGSP